MKGWISWGSLGWRFNVIQIYSGAINLNNIEMFKVQRPKFKVWIKKGALAPFLMIIGMSKTKAKRSNLESTTFHKASPKAILNLKFELWSLKIANRRRRIDLWTLLFELCNLIINKKEACASFLLMMHPTLTVHVAVCDFFWSGFSDF